MPPPKRRLYPLARRHAAAVEPDKVDAKLVSVLSELVLAQISEDGRFTRLISGSDLAELINRTAKAGARLRRVLDDRVRQSARGPLLLVGEIGLIGEQTLNLKILDVKNAKVVAREGGVAETTDQAPGLAKDFLATFFASAVKRAKTSRDAQDIAVLDLMASNVKPSMASALGHPAVSAHRVTTLQVHRRRRRPA